MDTGPPIRRVDAEPPRDPESTAADARRPGPRARASDGDVWVVMPAYNAALTLDAVIGRLPEDLRHRLIILDDGSSDDTGGVVERARDRCPELVHLRRTENAGYARAQKALFDEARKHRPKAVALLHADGQYPPERIPELVGPILKGAAECVFGSRMNHGVRSAIAGGMPRYKALANRITTRLENWTFGLQLGEYHSGFVAYSGAALESIPYRELSNSFHFDAEMLIMTHKLGMIVHEISIPTRYGSETSHLDPLRYGASIVKTLLRELLGRYDGLARSSDS